MPPVVRLAAVDQLVQLLASAGVTATADPAGVRTPGAWVRHAGLDVVDNLAGGTTHKLQLHLVVADNGYLRARDELVRLLNQVLTVWTPDDDAFFQGLQLPDSGRPLPGLVVPIDLPDDFTFEE